MAGELHAEQILELEFEYARETAMQAQNDRTVIVNLYLLLVGGVGSLLLAASSLTSGPSFLPPHSLSILFGVLGVLGALTLFKLIRLRQAWYDSARAMNTIKAHYLSHFPELDSAFLWKSNTIPPLGKPWSITFILSVMVVLLSSLSLAIALHYGEFQSGSTQLLLDSIVFLLAFGIQILFYLYQLRPLPPPKTKTAEP